MAAAQYQSNRIHSSSSCLVRPNLYTSRWLIGQKHVVYICNKEKKSEQQPKLHVDWKKYTKKQELHSAIYE
jgi:hypothetical protein